MPKFLIVRPMVESKIFAEDQQKYWLGVSMLLYLVKHLLPDPSNMTRELLKANNGANPAVFKEFLCVIKYVLDTNYLGLKIEPMENSNKPWEIVCFSDCNYAGDPVNRRSTSVFILFVLGIPISWQSEWQKSVSLSTQRWSV